MKGHNSRCIGSMCGTKTLSKKWPKLRTCKYSKNLIIIVKFDGPERFFIILSHSLRRCGRNPFFQSDRYVKLWWYQTQKALCGRQKMEKLIILTKHVQWIFHCIQLCRCVAYWRKWPFHYSIFQRFSSFLIFILLQNPTTNTQWFWTVFCLLTYLNVDFNLEL